MPICVQEDGKKLGLLQSHKNLTWILGVYIHAYEVWRKRQKQGCQFQGLLGTPSSFWQEVQSSLFALSPHSWHQIVALDSQYQELVHWSTWFTSSLSRPKVNNVAHQTFRVLVHYRLHPIIHFNPNKFSQDQDTLSMQKSMIYASYVHHQIQDPCMILLRFVHIFRRPIGNL